MTISRFCLLGCSTIPVADFVVVAATVVVEVLAVVTVVGVVLVVVVVLVLIKFNQKKINLVHTSIRSLIHNEAI